MVRRTFFGNAGEIYTRDLTAGEVAQLAASGDAECIKEQLKKDYATAATTADKLNILAKGLGLV